MFGVCLPEGRFGAGRRQAGDTREVTYGPALGVAAAISAEGDAEGSVPKHAKGTRAATDARDEAK